LFRLGLDLLRALLVEHPRTVGLAGDREVEHLDEQSALVGEQFVDQVLTHARLFCDAGDRGGGVPVVEKAAIGRGEDRNPVRPSTFLAYGGAVPPLALDSLWHEVHSRHN